MVTAKCLISLADRLYYRPNLGRTAIFSVWERGVRAALFAEGGNLLEETL